MKSDLNQSVRALPPLSDPKHPGMFLISRIGLFSVLLFGVLIATGVYLASTVSLDIALSLNGTITSEKEFIFHTEKSRAALIETGTPAEIRLGNGTTIKATVISLQEAGSQNRESLAISLQPTDEPVASVTRYLQDNSGASVTATVFTRHSLWAFFRDKVEY